MAGELKILLLEDSIADVFLLQKVLQRADVKHLLQVVDSEHEFILKLDNFKPDVVLSDHALPSFNSMEALRIVKERGLDIPFILVTGTVSEEFAVSAIKAGADDYILKDRLTRLPSSIQSCLSQKRVSREKDIIQALHSQLQSAYNELEEKNRNITDSIHYAKRIQESLLPGSDVLKKTFPESFIFNKPKDVIGGDFYWFAEHDGKFHVAVADCTGHGVPGALMSMIGFSLLNEIVITNKIKAPADILIQLNRGIRKVLKQDMGQNESHAGMDIAICSIDIQNKKLEFAGANRPLVFCTADGNRLFKGNRGGIGGFHSSENTIFQTHCISFKEDDMIYLYTDGYSDQFGGRKKKKSKNSDIIKMLQSFHPFDASEQEKLFQLWIDKWKGELEQTDDILLLGIKFA
ncbi:MAG TPA: SpoIIE family protein phosphatase [Bacteroidia bacterium]|nr:SpoIIE family protein phosphatase [Bacteroidia bacterium]